MIVGGELQKLAEYLENETSLIYFFKSNKKHKKTFLYSPNKSFEFRGGGWVNSLFFITNFMIKI